MHARVSIAAASALLPLIQGCATWDQFQRRSPDWPWKNAAPCKATCAESDAIHAFVKAHEFCRSVHNYYERGAGRANAVQTAVGTAGVLAGAVFAPLAGGSAATAWSGLSGAANAVQLSMNDAFSAALELKRQSAVASAKDEGVAEYKAAADPTAKVLAAVTMTNKCAMASAQADSKFLEAVAK